MGIFHDNSDLHLSDEPYRNYDAVAIGTVLAAGVGAYFTFEIVDAMRIVKEPFFEHVKLAITDFNLYSDYLSQIGVKKSLILWSFPILFNCFIQYASFQFFGKLINPLKHLRGRRWLKGKEALGEARRSSKAWLNQSTASFEILKNIHLSSDRLLKSILLVGTQGGGKTQILNLFLTQALEANHKSLVFDPTKGDYVQWIDKRVLISSTDSRTSHWWLGYDIQNDDDACAFSEGLITESKEPMWSNSARLILSGVLIHLIKEKGEDWSWADVSEILNEQESIQFACQSYPPASPLVADLESKSTQSILTNLIAYSQLFYTLTQNFSRVDGKKFSFVDFILNDNSKVRRVVFAMNQRSPADAAAARALVNLLTRRIASLEFPESKTRKTGWWLDEIVQFGRLENIAKLMEVGRSKGIYCVAATQDFSQVTQVYSPEELDKWDALFGLKIFPEIAGKSSQEFVSKIVGKREVQLINKGTSGKNAENVSISLSAPTLRDVILPSEMATFGKRANGIEALWIGYSQKFVLSLTTPFINPPAMFKNFEPWPEKPHSLINFSYGKNAEEKAAAEQTDTEKTLTTQPILETINNEIEAKNELVKIDEIGSEIDEIGSEIDEEIVTKKRKEKKPRSYENS